MTRPRWGQEPVERRGTESQQLFAHRGRNAFLEVRQPERDDRLEPLAARLFAGQPERLERPQHPRRVISRLRPGTALGRAIQRSVQPPQSGFTVIAANRTKLVEDFALMLPSASLVTLVNPAQILRLCFDTHCRCLGNHDYESTNRLTLCQACLPGNIYREAMRSSACRITGCLSPPRSRGIMRDGFRPSSPPPAVA